MDEDAIIRGILNVTRQEDYSRHVKFHVGNLGPHSSGNPKVCMDCGKPATQWTDGSEPCPGRDPFGRGGRQGD